MGARNLDVPDVFGVTSKLNGMVLVCCSVHSGFVWDNSALLFQNLHCFRPITEFLLRKPRKHCWPFIPISFSRPRKRVETSIVSQHHKLKRYLSLLRAWPQLQFHPAIPRWLQQRCPSQQSTPHPIGATTRPTRSSSAPAPARAPSGETSTARATELGRLAIRTATPTNTTLLSWPSTRPVCAPRDMWPRRWRRMGRRRRRRVGVVRRKSHIRLDRSLNDVLIGENVGVGPTSRNTGV